jgi:hypothetical protein
MTIGSVATEGREFPEHTIYTDDESALYYVPFVAADGRVGYRVGIAREWTPEDERASWETFVYLNPSSSIDAPAPNVGDVFVYVGAENDPAQDEPVVFVAITEESFQPHDVVADLLNEPEWCLHCGSNTCEHATKHNAAYGRNA